MNDRAKTSLLRTRFAELVSSDVTADIEDIADDKTLALCREIDGIMARSMARRGASYGCTGREMFSSSDEDS